MAPHTDVLHSDIKQMKARQSGSRLVREHRKNLKRLIDDIGGNPFEFLPERSVECLSQFLSGFGILGPALHRDLASFEHWLVNRLFYPNDTGAPWYRAIQLNAKDDCDGFELCLKLYSEYAREDPVDRYPNVQEFRMGHRRVDFYLHLYAISRRPGLYLGCGDRVQSLAAYVAGYFRGKKTAGQKLTKDEREFLRFEEWLRRHHKLPKCYPWYRLIEMWPYADLNSFHCFFAYYDAYLTDFGKRARGLEDLFETVTENQSTTIRRRKRLPAKPILIPDSKWWWRRQDLSR